MTTPLLSVTYGPLLATPHLLVTHDRCSNPGHCPICDGGLALCAVCGALEGALLDSCPGVLLTMAQHDWNYAKYCRLSKVAHG